MEKEKQDAVVRQYEIGGTTYIVKACVKSGAAEDASAIVRRLIANELHRQKEADAS